MTAVLMTIPVIKFTDSTGAPLAGGKVYFFAAGTSTPKDTFTTAAGNVANTNPVILDSSGAAIIFLSGSYKVNVTDSAGSQQGNWPVDNITSFSTGASGGTFLDGAFTLQNSGDPTKQAVLSLSGITTGATRTITIPDSNFTIATKASVDAIVQGGLSSPGYVSGNYYHSPFDDAGTTYVIAQNTLYGSLVYIPSAITITKLSINVGVGQAGKSARLGIYANSSGVPGALLLDAGTVALDTTGVKEITGLSKALTGGTWYFFTVLSDSTSATAAGPSAYTSQSFLGDVTVGTGAAGFTASQAYGALPGTFGTAARAATAFTLFYRNN